METLILDKREGFAILTLNRPREMNALSRQLRKELDQALDNCTADENIRVLILTGSGRAFCAGLDLKELSEAGVDGVADIDSSLIRKIEAFEGPVIGAINGHAITGGFELALACDVLIAGKNARFADTHARVGLLPGWGLSQKLPRMIGMSRAKEMSFSGAPVFAQQAYEWGLVNHVVPADELLDTAIAMAENMCQCVPAILRQYKRLIEDGFSMPYKESLAWEQTLSIESAKENMGGIAQRREAVMNQGRSEKNAS